MITTVIFLPSVGKDTLQEETYTEPFIPPLVGSNYTPDGRTIYRVTSILQQYMKIDDDDLRTITVFVDIRGDLNDSWVKRALRR